MILIKILFTFLATGMDTINNYPTLVFHSQRTDQTFINDFFKKWDAKLFVKICKKLIFTTELFKSPREVVLAFLSGLIGHSGIFNTNNLLTLHYVANIMAYLGLKSRLTWQTSYDGINHYKLNILEEFGLDKSYFINFSDILINRKRKEVHGWVINKNDLIPFKGTSSNIKGYLSGKISTLSKTAIENIPIEIEHKNYFPVTILSKESIELDGVIIETETGRYICMGLNTKDEKIKKY